jgi:hypothetical protein
MGKYHKSKRCTGSKWWNVISKLYSTHILNEWLGVPTTQHNTIPLPNSRNIAVMLQLLSVPGFWRVVGSLLAAESSVRRPIRGLGFPCPGGREIALGSTSDAPEQIAFGSTCDALGLRGARERERAIANVTAKLQCLHRQCSKCNCHMQGLALCLTTKVAVAAAPPPHGEDGGRSGGACGYASVCTRNSTLPINNFCSTPHFFPEHTG